MLECDGHRAVPLAYAIRKMIDDNSSHFSIIKERHVFYPDVNIGMFRICMVDNKTPHEKAVINIIRMYTYTRRLTNVQPHHPCYHLGIGCCYTGWAARVLHLVGMQTAKTKESSEPSPRRFFEKIPSFIPPRAIKASAFGCL